MALGLIVVGALIAVGSFIFAAVNMAKQAKNVFDGDFDKASSGFGGMFTRHIGAMIGMVVGGAILSIGLIMGGVQLIQPFVR